MKPLLRIIVGPVIHEGLRVLECNVANLKKIYPEFDLLVCYNQLDPNTLRFLGVPLFDQSPYARLFHKPKDEIWKIYPPRLRIDSHEIVMDNDVLIMDRVQSIDNFLLSDSTLLLQGTYRLFGRFDVLIPSTYLINSGIFGMPPGYDFEQEITKILLNDQFNCWLQDRDNAMYDDQGIISACLLKYHQVMIIPPTEVFNCNYDFPVTDLPPYVKGIHFMKVNRFEHNCWEYFKQQFIPKKKIYL